MANSESQRLKDIMATSNRGILAFNSKVAHWLNSAPDYFHRFALFAGEAMKEGVLDVDSMGNPTKDSALQYIDGQLIYDEKKDKRFSLLFNEDADKKSIPYLEQKALYTAMKEKLAQEPEGLTPDGKLNRAYTQEQIEDKTRFSNMIFGDYSYENRNKWQRTAMGSMFWQFANWMKGKKDMYLKERAEVGLEYKPYFFKYNIVITTQEYSKLTEEEINDFVSKGYQIGNMPEGRLHEGIVQTFIYMYHELSTKGFKEGSQAILNMEGYRKRNLGQLFGDLILMMLVAMLAKEMFKSKEDEMLVNFFERSTYDLNVLNLVGLNPYQPFAGSGLPFVSTQFIEGVYFDVARNFNTPENMIKRLSSNVPLIRDYDRYFAE
jgi:hypothetical protein